MNPNRVDFLIDVSYGLLIFVAIVLIVAVGPAVIKLMEVFGVS